MNYERHRNVSISRDIHVGKVVHDVLKYDLQRMKLRHAQDREKLFLIDLAE